METEKPKTRKYVVIGDLCMDVFMQVDAYPAAGGDGIGRKMHQSTGGSAANTAIGLAKLGGKPALLTHTGVDIWAEQMLPILQNAGVATERIIQEVGEASGLTFAVVSGNAERTLFTYRGANRNLQPDEIDILLFQGTDFLHISSYACLDSPQTDAVLKAVHLAVAHATQVSLDVGVEPASQARDMILQLMPLLALIILGKEEALELTQASSLTEAINELLLTGVKLIALKLGKDGCRLISSIEDVDIPGFAIEAVDTTGSGDAFCAGMIHGLTQDWPLEECGLFANALGAIVASQWGAGENMPYLKEGYEFLSLKLKDMPNKVLSKLVKKLGNGLG